MSNKAYSGYLNPKYTPKADLVAAFYIEPAAHVSFEEAAQAVASESSIGTWTNLATLSPKMKRKLHARVFSLNKRSKIVKIAYPLSLFENGSVPQLLSSIAGNVFGMKEIKNLRLLDINFPNRYIRAFKGPAFGIDGVRRILKVPKRPLLGTIVKPKLGLNEKQHAKVAEQACDAKNAIIIGGGAIAMKAIQNFKKIGLNISIIEKASHLWPIGFDRKVARIVEKKIKANGIHIYLNEEVVEFRSKNKKLSSIILKSGREILADLAVITIGMKPNIDFLTDTDVKVDKGILVDMYMRTNIPNIFAAGDVVQMYDPLYNMPILHPTWGNAKRQGKIAAKNMTGGNEEYTGTIPIQTIKIFGFKAIAVGITHSKKNFDEISWVSFEKDLCRKFILEKDHLVGALVLGKEINKKILKPILKKAVFNKVNVNYYKHLLLNENLDFNMISKKIEIET